MNKIFFVEALKQKDKSSDPSTKVGCVIVKDNEIITKGFNTLPRGLKIADYPLDNRGDGPEHFDLNTKYPYILHSEANAIVNAKCDLTGASIYVTLFPCNECAKLIIEAQIKNLYYIDDIYADNDNVIASKKMLSDAKVHFEQVKLDREND